jgi:hypothetical protein
VSVLFTADNQAYRATTGLPGTVSTTIFWAYLVGTRAADGTMAVWNASGTNGHNVEVNATTGVLHFDSITGGFDSSATFTAGVWRKVALVLNGTSATLYSANTGSALASVGTNTTTALTYSDLYIGAFNNATSGVWFNGRIANLKVYNAVLTLAEMEAELASWTAIRTANLMRHHKFQVAETTDYSGNGNTLTGGTGATTAGDPAGLTTGGSNTPTIRSVSSKGKVNGSDLTVAPTKPTGLALNDYILVLQASDADGGLANMTAPSGFVTLASQAGGTTNNYGGMKIWGKVAVAADVAASTFTFGYDAAGDGAVIMIAITAGTYNTTTPITLAGTFTVQARIASAVQTVASMTGVANALLIGMLSTDTNGTVESYPAAGMTGFTLVGSQIGIAAPFVLAGAYSKALVAAGATGASTVTPTGAGTSNGWVSTALLVNPLPDDGTSFFYELAA